MFWYAFLISFIYIQGVGFTFTTLTKTDWFEPADVMTIVIISLFWPIFWVGYLGYRILKRPVKFLDKVFDKLTTFVAERMM